MEQPLPRIAKIGWPTEHDDALQRTLATEGMTLLPAVVASRRTEKDMVLPAPLSRDRERDGQQFVMLPR